MEPWFENIAFLVVENNGHCIYCSLHEHANSDCVSWVCWWKTNCRYLEWLFQVSEHCSLEWTTWNIPPFLRLMSASFFLSVPRGLSKPKSHLYIEENVSFGQMCDWDLARLFRGVPILYLVCIDIDTQEFCSE